MDATPFEDRLLLTGAVLLLGVLAAILARRLRLPVLIGFLGLGMLLGSEGVGGIEFDDPDLARSIGVVALVLILFEGGLTSDWRDVRPVIVPASILATLGVAITAALTGAAAYALFDLSPSEALLLGAVVGSTDAAAVFATLRFTTLRRRLGGLLEAESGLNDPMAVALTLGMIEWVQDPAYGVPEIAVLLLRQLGVGLVFGLVLGWAAVRAIRLLPPDIGPFAPVGSVALAALAYALADLVGASGFLAVYVVAMFVGNARTSLLRTIVPFHEGVAFTAQVVLFVVLGLLVFPSELLPVAAAAVALAAALALVARPAAVLACTALQRFSAQERTLLGWAGLRGAVPIVLATFVQSAGLAASDTIFNVVFFVVVVSALAQGPTLEPLARRLGLATESRPFYRPPVEVGAIRELGGEIVEHVVARGDGAAGSLVRELGLPREALIVLVVRDGRAVPPRGSTRIEPGDRLYLLATRGTSEEVAAVVRRWEAQGAGTAGADKPPEPGAQPLRGGLGGGSR